MCHCRNRFIPVTSHQSDNNLYDRFYEGLGRMNLKPKVKAFHHRLALREPVEDREPDMDSELSFQIMCSLCLSDFTDPVTLSCEHSFCRLCITGHMQASLVPNWCPQCRKPYSDADLRPSRLLRNMTETVRGHLATQRSRTDSSLEPGQAAQAQSDELVCSEHDEKLKLFCETDQKLVCVVCRDGSKHQGHQFKPVQEASQLTKGKVKGFLGFMVKENRELDRMTEEQTSEITVTQMRSKDLSDQISEQFEKMHLFLKKKEEEIKEKLKTEEQKDVKAMSQNNCLISKRQMDGRETECIFQSALEISQPDMFLQWWNEKGFPVTERMKAKDHVGPEPKYNSRVKDLHVKPRSLFLGPLETHLQFFVWKEMLTAISPVAEILSINDTSNSYLKVSPGKLSVRQADRQSSYYKDYNPGITSSESFQTGQHYWEIEVGKKLDWSVGLKMEEAGRRSRRSSAKSSDILFNLKNEQGYSVITHGKESNLELKRKPSKIGLYLDCDRKLVVFYDADIMREISQVSYSSDRPCTLTFFPGIYLDGANADPLTVCSYNL